MASISIKMHLLASVIGLVILCVIVQVKSEKNSSCESHKSSQLREYTRVKRAKYYSYPSRFYRKPPMVHQIKGPYSYTPPPSYKDEERQYPARSSKVSTNKRPSEGLDDEDINNLVKHLSKKDLEKLIESAGGKYTDNREYRDDFDESKPNYKKPDYIFKETLQEIDDEQKFLLNNPNVNYAEASQPKIIYVNTPTTANLGNSAIKTNQPNNIVYVNREEFINLPNYVAVSNSPRFQPNMQTSMQDQSYPGPYQDLQNAKFETKESKKSYQIAYVTPHSPSLEENVNDGNIFTDSKVMQEETLPKPVNLRETEYEAAYSNNAPTVVKSNSYQLEDFGNLPLMNYQNSKLHLVSSYNVPHYTVTSHAKSNSSPSQSVRPSAPALEPAPPKSAAQAQSDAHLKAIKIWTHKSRGTAYTLHDDGTLSLEKPNRPRGTSYGPPY